MVGSPQHTLQIMEIGTRFDLTAAVRGWRDTLAVQPGMSPGDRRELEAHLDDAISGYRRRGLTDEESFWLACRRVGRPEKLAEEFTKTDPAEVWRERVLWLSAGICLIFLWRSIWGSLMAAFAQLLDNQLYLPQWVLFYLPLPTRWVADHVLRNGVISALFGSVPFIFLLTLLARGRMGRVISALDFVFKSRGRFLAVAGVMLGLYCAWAGHQVSQHPVEWYATGPNGVSMRMVVGRNISATMTTYATMVGLIAWLMPGNQRRDERQNSAG